MDLETVVPVVFFGLYPIPTLIAWLRNHPNAVAITVVDYFAGWTLVGWVIALVWALRTSPAVKTAPVENTAMRPHRYGRGALVEAFLAWGCLGIVAYFLFVIVAAVGGAPANDVWFGWAMLGAFAILIWVPVVVVIVRTLRWWKEGRDPRWWIHRLPSLLRYLPGPGMRSPPR